MQFSPAMKVNEVLAQHPAARWVLAAYHINGCGSCASADDETLEEVAVAYRIPLEKLIGDLNKVCGPAEASPHT